MKVQKVHKKVKTVSAKKTRAASKPVAQETTSSTSPPSAEMNAFGKGISMQGKSLQTRRVTDPEDDATILVRRNYCLSVFPFLINTLQL